MKNAYEIRGDVTAIFINSSRFGNMETLISTSKLPKMDEYPNTWVAQWGNTTKSFYIAGAIGGAKNRKRIYLHSFLTDCPNDFVTDHRSGNTLDNTDENLRVVNHAENAQNRKALNSNNKSGVRNVSWCEKDQRWRICFPVDGKTKCFGQYQEFEKAAKIANELRLLHMPFAK